MEESPRKFLSGVIRSTSELAPFSRNTFASPDSINITWDTNPPCLQIISPFLYLIFTELASRKSLCSGVRFSKHLHSWKLKVHAENFVDSSITFSFKHKDTKESWILMMWISSWLNLDQFYPNAISAVFSFTNLLIIQSLQPFAHIICIPFPSF